MITLVTPTLPERADLLAELTASVGWQTTRPAAHLIEVDAHREGPATVRNRLVAHVTTDWFVPVDDDDLLDPAFLEVLTKHLSDDVDIVWPLCRIEGGRAWWEGVSVFDPDLLRGENFIPACAAIRTSLFRDLGGYRDGILYEDWDLWLRALDMGARFASTGAERLWTYRFGAWPRRSMGAA